MKTIKTQCPECGKITYLEMTDEQFDNYINQKGHVQDIFPDWSADKRELLITGICSKCWDNMFKL